MKLVVKPDMLFGKRGKSGLVALNLDLAEIAEFVKTRLGSEVSICTDLHFSEALKHWSVLNGRNCDCI